MGSGKPKGYNPDTGGVPSSSGGVDYYVNFERVSRLSDEILGLLDKRCATRIEGLLVGLYVSMLFEERYEISVCPEIVVRLRNNAYRYVLAECAVCIGHEGCLNRERLRALVSSADLSK
jgi:hypothetical protein